MTASEPFFRHVQACNNTRLPGGRFPFFLADTQVGWVGPELAAQLEHREVRHEGGRLILDDPLLLEPLGEELGKAGLFRWRDELFDVRATPDGPVLARLDRGALPGFGIRAEGVHLNGMVRHADASLHLWVGRRAADKLLDPGKLDHLVAGGVPAGHSVRRTLAKEGAEECGLPPELAEAASAVGVIDYVMMRPEGLRRDRLHCFDLMLPDSFEPVPHDGEVESFMLMPMQEAFRLCRDTDGFKFNVNLVLIDLFLRHGLIDPDSADGSLLRRGLSSDIIL